jgi:acyl carrier protein
MDALMHYRRSQNLPGISINWGPWTDGGMAANLSKRNQTRLVGQGIELMPAEQGLRILLHMLRARVPQIGAFKIDWKAFQHLSLSHQQRLFLSQIIGEETEQEETGPSPDVEPALLQQLRDAPPNTRKELIITHIQAQVAGILGLDATHLPNAQQGFFDMGLDSLMAIELKNRLEHDLRVTLPATLAFEYPTIHDLAEYILDELPGLAENKTAGLPTPATPQHSTDDAEKLESLSEEELAALLANELEQSTQR